ncbi:uncharacterized protein PITG_19815 [Phytophthora infestans T30-4]|uniref:Uncharacterized protein n=1 Tax=Phytophthora infestans (strain T30-4) TaxID=403677 RepID=D0P1G5_PHYIT|nr:uncharacterized protein PITG_19815 [Phytophthora infestans T30-4]EEY54587.1 conserved hypothetical protein [Phytophthora infestans T30-4]|eukprot:XP_002895867.1 conserved hypothetical protein [Phytophthora infestans T30-4]
MMASTGDLIYDVTLPPHDKESRTIRELRRRNAVFMVVEPLDEVSCLAILEMYEQRFSRELDSEVKQLIVSARGSSNPLYVRLLLNGLELFDLTENDQRQQWLKQACESNQLNGVYELLMKQWNVILLKDMFAELHEHTAMLKTATLNPLNDGGDLGSLRIKIEQRALLIRHTLSLLAVCRYGLSETDFARLFGDGVPQRVCQQLLALLKPHLMTIYRHDCKGAVQLLVSSATAKSYGNQESGGETVVLYDLSHNQLRLLTRYGFLGDEQLRNCYYRELAVYFEAMEACQRRVDELPVQLERCSMWGVLQNALVNMNMFQLWWSERNRQEFFFYWMVLSSNCSLHDPVDDFVRSLDEYIAQEAPSPEQLLSIFLTITEFLRAWQKVNESRGAHLELSRPKPPQLQEFLNSLGNFSTSSLSESEADRVQKEIDALVFHQDDGYYVRRWLWTQFPLIGTAFESRVFRSAASSRNSTRQNTVGRVLPESLGNPNKSLVSAKRRPPHKVAPSSGPEGLAGSEMGALEFLSAENSEGSLGSSQLLELRMKYDRVKFVAREKNEALKGLESRLMDAKAEVSAAGHNATQTDDLLESIRTANDEATLGRQRSDYYKLILRHCELYPGRDPNTIETAEVFVAKMKREIVEVQQKTQVVSYEKRLANLDVPKLVQVTQDNTSIHQEALSRLRWRQELDRRLYYASLSAKEGGRKASSVSRASISFPTEGDAEESTPVDPNFFRAKDKLIHMKEISLARQKHVENLQLYVGSAYKDDGILGALRQVGINKPEEALVYWQNQLDHSVQLEEEEKQAEQRVLEHRVKLEALQAQFVNLKLSGSSSGSGSLEDDAANSNGDDEAAASKTSVNVKILEKQLAEANAVKQKKKERAARLRSLQEKLHLGLLHIAELLGVTSIQQLSALELVDAIEKVVRVVAGDEAHLQAAPNPSFRHKNSTRMVTIAGQSGDSAGLPSDTRKLSDDDKVRYNIRISRTEKRQMNPYVDTDFDDDDHEVNYDEEDERDDAGNNTGDSDQEGSAPERQSTPNRRDSNVVKKRQDIKNRSKLELERKKAAQKKKTND